MSRQHVLALASGVVAALLSYATFKTLLTERTVLTDEALALLIGYVVATFRW